MFCAEVFTCLTKRKQAQVIKRNLKNMCFFDLKVALFWTQCNKIEKINCAYLTNDEKEREKNSNLCEKGLAISETKWYYTNIKKPYAQKVKETVKKMTR